MNSRIATTLVLPADDAAMLQLCSDEYENEIQQASETFIQHMEDSDEYTCTRSELIESIRMAPTTVLRQILYTVYMHRHYSAMASGISWI